MSRIITAAELRHRTFCELKALHRRLLTELMRSAPGSADRRNALVSLETVERAMAQRRPPGKPALRP